MILNKMKIALPIIFALSLFQVNAQVQEDSISIFAELEEVVISASRSERSIYEVGAAVQVITAQEIGKSGTERLSDILSRQAGINLTHEHGVGVQLMGLASEYIMILINGQPVAGRTAGVLDLDRISVSNVKRIEIIRGPSSSLYGSEALAGVINIITDDQSTELGMIEVQYRRFNTANVSARFQRRKGQLQWRGFGNFYGGSGYDLKPEAYGPTAPPFRTGTLENHLKWKVRPKHEFLIDSRMYFEKQLPSYRIATEENISGFNRVTDIGTTLQLNSVFRSKTKGVGTLYHSFYTNTTEHQLDESAEIYYRDFFHLHFFRPEYIAETRWSDVNRSNYGVGGTFSFIKSDRYEGAQSMHNYFAFAQHEWDIISKIRLISGIRWDGQSSFGHQVNPKISILYRPTTQWNIRASAGTGFKAPDPRQLFLNFSNPLAGYSVFGALVLEEGLSELDQQGQLAEILAMSYEQALNAERSYAFNVGYTWRPVRGVSVESDAFFNHVYNLIDTRAVARKTNGQTVFSYYNVNRIFTAGIHSQITYRKQGWIASVAYEFLKTGDYEVLQGLRKGIIYRRNAETFATERVQSADYFGLFNRPRHTGSLALMYTHPLKQWFINSRAVFRGQFGFGDVNGNQIPDIAAEMGPRHILLYLSGGTTVWDNRLEISAGIDNLSNFTSVEYLPSINGINPWIKVRYIFHSNQQ
jgi:outer membrane receptor for ferrienterochelin and colicins